jgi:anaerobic magnesium-protoporphyrin IX monomethyl ester cyclase
MNVCLINPPFRRSIFAPLPAKLEEASGKYPSLGLGYIAAMLEKHGHIANYVEMDALDMDRKTLEKTISGLSPEIVGITCTSSTLGQVKEVAKIVRNVSPESFIVVGGSHLGIYPEETLRTNLFDAGIQGEGEYAVLDLVEALEGHDRDLSSVKGVIFSRSNKVVVNDPAPPVMDLDELPYPSYHLMPIEKYSCPIAVRHPFMTMITSRGCPFHCFFCHKMAHGKLCRRRDPAKVVDEMEFLMNEYNVREILLQDEEFTLDKKHVIGICDEIIRRKLDILWDCKSRVDTVNEEMLSKMKAAGCDRIHYGVEAYDQRILNILRKGITPDQVRKTFQLTHDMGITILAYFMIGTPGESLETMKNTVEFSKELDPEYAQYAITTAFPGTDLYKFAMEKGFVKSDVWREYTLGEIETQPLPYFETEEYSKEDLEALVRRAYRSFYLRPRYIMKRIAGLRNKRELLGGLRGFLALLRS